MSQYYKTKFWERWLAGVFIFAPITLLSSCMAGFVLMDQVRTGLLVWACEDIIFALLLASCPHADVFKKPWWDRSEDD